MSAMRLSSRILFLGKILIRSVFFYHEVVDDEVLPLRGVLAHVVAEQFLYLVGLVQADLFQPYLRSDELLEFIGRDFTETFEPGDLRIGAEFPYGVDTLFFRIAVARGIFGALVSVAFLEYGGPRRLVIGLGGFCLGRAPPAVADSEQWGLQYVDMAFLYQIRKEL